MSISVNKGEVWTIGDVETLVSEFGVLTLELLSRGVPKMIIDEVVEMAFKEHKKNNQKEPSKNLRQLLKNLGLED